MNLNVLMDAKDLYIDGFLPCQPRMRCDCKGEARHYTRTQRPPGYFLIDFGTSHPYDASNTDPLEYHIWGDNTVPGFQKSNPPCNPFPPTFTTSASCRWDDFSPPANTVNGPVNRRRRDSSTWNYSWGTWCKVM
ncbi:hypothetical protein BV22DRAFT_790217 [Leucogyrophana mollusca]|uniref:Uncharacterized protein n=1 Tax=Leucogyrophana mollusca TaxID=85980 RepID=A0ACB8B5U8_9AGAM|nr:hypothetical protein BV22DRAFT_790217 [Leucogyrophana mollusca]